jgi:DNA invertase Pin-like site-specific DNA recombinase
MHAPPLAYGYMLALDDMLREEIDHDEAQVMAYAKHEGYDFARMFFEWNVTRRPAITLLIAELRRTRADYVIVPSLSHFGESSTVQNVTRNRLSRIGRATVLIVDEDRADD